MNDAQQQTSAVVDGNDSDVDSDDDVPMGLSLGAVTAAGVGDGGCAGAVCSVFCGLPVLFIAPLASSESFPPSRWAVGQRL